MDEDLVQCLRRVSFAYTYAYNHLLYQCEHLF
jgi:hypothetical protein